MFDVVLITLYIHIYFFFWVPENKKVYNRMEKENATGLFFKHGFLTMWISIIISSFWEVRKSNQQLLSYDYFWIMTEENTLRKFCYSRLSFHFKFKHKICSLLYTSLESNQVLLNYFSVLNFLSPFYFHLKCSLPMLSVCIT